MEARQESSTERWLAAEPALAPLDGPAGTAERLLLLVHYGMDWTDWVGRYRSTYWDALLPDRVVVATFRADTLLTWWSVIQAELPTKPRNAAERLELVQLLAQDSLPVLEQLRTHTEALLLRTRIVADAVRAQRTSTLGVG